MYMHARVTYLCYGHEVGWYEARPMTDDDDDQEDLDAFGSSNPEEDSDEHDDHELDDFRRFLRLEQSHNEKTIEHHALMAEKFLEFADVEEPGKEEVLDYKEHLMEHEEKDYSASHINNALKAAEYYLKFQGNSIGINKLPRVQKRPNPLSDAEVEALLNAAKTYRDTAIIQTMLSTGLRATELIELELDDLDLNEGLVRVQEGKGMKQRDTFLTEEAADALEQYLGRRPDCASDALFVSERSDALSRSGLYQLVKRTADRADLDRDDVSPHTLRQTFATRLTRAGANAHMLKKLMGHTDIRSSEHYVDLDRETLKDKHHELLEADDDNVEERGEADD